MRSFRLLVPWALSAALLTGCGQEAKPAPPVSNQASAPAPTTQAAEPPADAPAANGVDKLTAAQIVTKTKQAALSAKTVRIKANVPDGAQSMSWDMRLKGSAGGAGTITMAGSKVEIIRIGKVAYLKGDAAFYRSTGAGADGAKLLQGKYMKVKKSDKDMSKVVSFTDVDEMMTMLFSDLKPGDVRKGKRKDAAGRPAITLEDPAKDGGTLYVALEGKPYPLRIEPSAASGETGSVDFLDYDEPVTLKAPPASLVIDIAKLKSGSG
jgi:hypothetical protein